MSGDSSEAKTRQATPRKLRKQREEGQVAQTKKLVSLGTTAVGLGVALAMAPGVIGSFAVFFDATFLQLQTPLSQARTPMIDSLASTFVQAVASIVVAVTFTAIALTIMYHKGIPFSAKPLVPKYEKIDPAKGLKRMFGKRSWIEAGVGLVQIILWMGLGGAILWGMLHQMLAVHSCGLPCAGAVAELLARRLIYAAIGFCVVMMGLDMLLQRYLYAQDQRMTNSEYKREMKDNFGAAETRSARRRLRNEAMEEVEATTEHAGVELANMCFFTAQNAVAIRYHPRISPLPRVAASARGPEAALAMRKAIAENGFKELEDAKITDNCLSVRPGMGVPEHMFLDLALGMKKIFS